MTHADLQVELCGEPGQLDFPQPQPGAVGSAGIYLVLNIGGGLAYGFALGWGGAEALVVGGILGISSTAIVTKLLVENRRLGNLETRVILGIAVIEDIFLAFYLALL